MAVMSLSYGGRQTKLGGLILDLTLTEEVSFENEATQFPVEDGSIISDHITEGAEKIRIGGVIATQDVVAFEYEPEPEEERAHVVDVVEQCRGLYKRRELVEVSTGQLLFSDMAFTRLTATRTSDPDGGNWISIQAELTKIKKVNLKTAEVPAEAKASKKDGAKGRAGKTNQKNQQGQGQGPQGKGKSALAGIEDAGGGDVIRGGAKAVGDFVGTLTGAR